MSDLRADPNWDEARFRLAYNIPPGEEIEGIPPTQSSQKRQVQGELSFGSGQSSKRFRRNGGDDDDDDDVYNNPITPTRSGGQCARFLPNIVKTKNR